MSSAGSGRRAVVLGATGLVGSHCLRLLLESPAYSEVACLVRRAIPFSHPKLRQELVDFEKLAARPEALACDDLYSCLGTTILKAGSQEAFERVDLGYALEAARLASAQGASRLLLVSSVGASASSRNFYLRTKGRLEEAVRALPFRAVHVMRPSFLKGARGEHRPGEALAIPVFSALSPLLAGPLRKYRPVAAVRVAESMIRCALEGEPGFHVHDWPEISRGSCRD